MRKEFKVKPDFKVRRDQKAVLGIKATSLLLVRSLTSLISLALRPLLVTMTAMLLSMLTAKHGFA